MPDDARDAAVRYTRDGDGVVTLVLDQPGRSANLMNADYVDAMGVAVDRLEKERDDIRGVVVTSAKSTFFAGGDIDALYRVTRSNVGEFAEFLERAKDQLRRLECLGRPVAAALGGSALGGGLEIALACHHRIVLDDPRVKVGFPEVTVGLLPGAGGVTRTVRLLGLQAALPLLVEGSELRPAQAMQAGLVHEIAPTVADLLDRARAWVLDNANAGQPWDRPGFTVPGLAAGDANSYLALSAAPAMLHKRTHGAYPAPEKILAAAVEGAFVDVETAFAIESRYFLELVTSPIAKNMLGTLWYARNDVLRGASRPEGVERRAVEKVGVLGAGMMGSGIAYVSASSGIDVMLKDVSRQAADAGKERIAVLVDERLAKGRLTPDQRDEVLGRVAPVDADSGVAGCDFVVEAVFEDRDVKSTVLGAAQAAARPDAVIASNTSTLPITGLAKAVAEPERFVGLHFFSPVHKMPLVEIIRGEQTSDDTVARAFDYVRQIGKLPIVVNDSRGFFTSRVFGTYLNEGVAMVTEGVPPAMVENVARKAGMPVGPLAVADEVSLSLIKRIREQEVADLAMDERTEPEHPAYAVIEAMVGELGRSGKAGGAGFYDYPEGAPKRLWPELTARFADGPGEMPEDDVRDRLLFVQVLETVRCLEEGVVTSERDANVGSIFGIGFPAWTGGAVQFVRWYGVPAFVERAEELAGRYGDRFSPSSRLVGGLSG